MEKKMPIFFMLKYLLTVAALYYQRTYFYFQKMWTAIFISIYDRAVWWLAENVKSYVHRKKAYQ